MTSYIYFDCGCSFNVTEGDWSVEELCKKHKKEVKDDLR